MTLHNPSDHRVKRPCWFAKQRHHTPSFCHENTVKGYVFVASFFADKNCPTQGRVTHMNCICNMYLFLYQSISLGPNDTNR